MFFPRLRRQAKWMFVFLAIVFGLGYVIFNVGGSIPGTGLGDVLQGLGQTSNAGPSVDESNDKIKEEPNNPQGYRDLATALQRENRSAEAIAPLERYVQMRPTDQRPCASSVPCTWRRPAPTRSRVRSPEHSSRS